MSLRDLIHRVNEGDPVSAAQQNLTIEELLRAFSGWSSTAGPAGNTIHPAIYSIPLRVLNSTGVDLKRYEVVGLDDFYYDPSDSQKFVYWLDEIAFVGVTPDLASHRAKFAVVQDGIPKDEVGQAKVSGVTQVLLNVTDENHDWAEIADGKVEYLETGSSGSTWILKKQSGTGQKWAIVRFSGGSDRPIRCCLKEDHPGRGKVFDVYPGTHNPATHGWDFDQSHIAQAIDWWYSEKGPYPEAGAQAFFLRMPSNTYEEFYEVCGNMDCDSPGSCFGYGDS